MPAFDADAARAELQELEALLRTLEAEGADDETVLDVLSDVNELRDQLRNHEWYPPLWPAVRGSDSSGFLTGLDSSSDAAPEPLAELEDLYEGIGWRLRGMLTQGERVALLEAALGGPGFALDGTQLAERGWVSESASHGSNFRRSDDLELANVLWRRACELVPPVLEGCVAPAAEANMRSQLWPEFNWSSEWTPSEVDARVTYELLCPGDDVTHVIPQSATSPEAGSGGGGGSGNGSCGLRLDTEDADDRDDGGRPLLSLLVALGAEPDPAAAGDARDASATASVELEFAGDAASGGADAGAAPPRRRLRLDPGEAALFRRGDPRLAYRLSAPSGGPRHVLLHAKVLYVIRLPERQTGSLLRGALAKVKASRFSDAELLAARASPAPSSAAPRLSRAEEEDHALDQGTRVGVGATSDDEDEEEDYEELGGEAEDEEVGAA